MTKYITVIFITFFVFLVSAKTNYESFEDLSKHDTKEVKHLFKIPPIGQGIIISRKLIKPTLTLEILKKKKYSLDFMVSNLIIGTTLNYIYAPIIDFKIGIFLAYSLDKDYKYDRLFSGISLSILKF